MNGNIFLDQVANKIAQMGLITPAILLLETHKPVSFLGSQLALIAQPTLQIFLPRPLVQNTVDLLANTDLLEQLIIRLEQRAATREKWL